MEIHPLDRKIMTAHRFLFVSEVSFLSFGPMFNVKDSKNMKGLLLVKEIYLEGFRNLGHMLLKNYFKLFTWFCFAMFFVTCYAFIYRLATGFAFD